MPHLHFSRLARLIGAAVLLAAGLVGCGGGDPDIPPAEGHIGPAGGTITSADGKASLVIPAGALDRTVGVTLTAVADSGAADPQIVPGSVYAIDSPEVVLALPATLTLAVPAGAASGAQVSHAMSVRAQPQAVLTPPAPVVCDTGVAMGSEVPPGTQCYFDVELVDPAHCPAALPNYFGSFTLTLDVIYDVTGCEAPPVPAVQIAALPAGMAATVLETTRNPGAGVVSSTLGTLQPGAFGLLADHTPPVVALTLTVTPTSGGKGTVTLSAGAHDDVGVASVTLQRRVSGGNPPTFAAVDLATLTSPPFLWTSLEIPLDQIYYYFYVAVARDAAGNRASSVKSVRAPGSVPTAPQLAATPTALPIGGGNTLLSWATQNATTTSIDHGVGDVTGLTSKTVHVATTTAFTLTATNPFGSVTRTATVTVTPQPAPVIGTFAAAPAALAAGGGNVTLSWTASDADTLSIDHDVGVVNGTSVVVPVTTNTTFTLTASNGTGSVTRQTSVTVASAGDRYVDLAIGVDTQPCSQAAPCKTIAKAATGAPAGATVFLGDGVYPSTQASPTLPDGVGLRALHPGQATIAGLTVNAAGSSTVRDLVLDYGPGFACGRVVAQSSTGTPVVTLEGNLIRCIGAVLVAGNVTATMTPGALAGGVYTAALPSGTGALITVQGNGSLLILGGTFDGNGLGGAAFGGGLLSVLNQANLTLSGVTMQNRTQVGIGMASTGTLLVKDNTVFDHVGIAGNCPVGSSIVINGAAHVTLDHVQIGHSPAAALCVRNTPGQVPTIVLTQTALNANFSGIASEIGSGSSAALTASGLALTSNTYGIIWEGVSGSLFDITGASITGNGIGIHFSYSAGALRLRGSTISGNSDVGLALYNTAVADLGTQASPGLNTITGNVNAGVKANLNPGLSFTAVGNTWIPGVQGADAAGLYSKPPGYGSVPLTGPTVMGTGLNVVLPANVSASL